MTNDQLLHEIKNELKQIRTTMTTDMATKDDIYRLENGIAGLRVEMNNRFKDVDDRFNEVDERFAEMNERFNGLHVAIGDALSASNDVSEDNFRNLDQRVTRLERRAA